MCRQICRNASMVSVALLAIVAVLRPAKAERPDAEEVVYTSDTLSAQRSPQETAGHGGSESIGTSESLDHSSDFETMTQEDEAENQLPTIASMDDLASKLGEIGDSSSRGSDIVDSEPADIVDAGPSLLDELEHPDSQMAIAQEYQVLDADNCGGMFAGSVLNEKMTVVSLDPPDGCTPGLKSDKVFAYFVGGNIADCRPPPGKGCQRFVLARYGDKCDLSELYNLLGKSVPIGEIFDKDGLYKKCSRKPLLEMRTVRYIKGLNMLLGECTQDYCDIVAGALEAEPDGGTRAQIGGFVVLMAACMLGISASRE